MEIDFEFSFTEFKNNSGSEIKFEIENIERRRLRYIKD
jgi:hypothetical protein